VVNITDVSAWLAASNFQCRSCRRCTSTLQKEEAADSSKKLVISTERDTQNNANLHENCLTSWTEGWNNEIALRGLEDRAPTSLDLKTCLKESSFGSIPGRDRDSFGTRDSSVVQRWATGWMMGGSSPSRGWEFFSSPPRPDWLWALPASYPMGTRGSFPEGIAARRSSWPLTPHIISRSITRGAIPSLPQYAYTT
jgi:hypothetical protein